jgi:hypothetical protein
MNSPHLVEFEIQKAKQLGLKLAVKLVRGAYLKVESERKTPNLSKSIQETHKLYNKNC